MCNTKPKEICCFCSAPWHGVRMMPLFDVIELILYIVFCIVAYFNQDTWLIQITILILTNAGACVLKLLGSLPMLTVGSPDSKSSETTVWPHRCYFLMRMLGFLINVLGLLAQITVSSIVINKSTYYDDPTYGICTFCYKIEECRTSHIAYIQGLYQTALTKGLPLSSSSDISFAQYFHRNMSPQQCSIVTGVVMVTISIAYLFTQIHFIQMIRYTWDQILKKNKLKARQQKLKEKIEMSGTRSLNKSNTKSGSKMRLEELENIDFQNMNLNDVSSDNSDRTDQIKIKIPRKLKQGISSINFDAAQQKEMLNDYIDNRLALYQHSPRHSRLVSTPVPESSLRFGTGDQVCMICQERILKNQQIIQLDCLHIYHIHCAKRWLVDNRNNCPVCRADIIASVKKEES